MICKIACFNELENLRTYTYNLTKSSRQTCLATVAGISPRDSSFCRPSQSRNDVLAEDL